MTVLFCFPFYPSPFSFLLPEVRIHNVNIVASSFFASFDRSSGLSTDARCVLFWNGVSFLSHGGRCPALCRKAAVQRGVCWRRLFLIHRWWAFADVVGNKG